MSRDINRPTVGSDDRAERTPSPVARPTSPLARPAFLTIIGSVLRQSAQTIAALIATPILVQGLGEGDYGVLLAVQQLIGLLVLADQRTSGTLKFLIATRDLDASDAALRRLVGSAVIAWLRVLPIIALAGVLLTSGLPSVIDLPGETPTYRQFAALLFVAAVLDRFLSLPSHVLRGMNLDFKAVRIDAVTLSLGTIVGAMAVRWGYGLVGFAVVALGRTMIVNGIRFVVARRNVSWFGVRKPKAKSVRSFVRTSRWLATADVGLILLFGLEITVAGVVVGASGAAAYGATQFAARTMTTPAIEIVGSVGPGLARLAVAGRWEDLHRLRAEMLITTTGIFTIIGLAMASLNEVFISSWLSGDLYGGQDLTLLLALGALAGGLYRTDAVVLDALVAFRQRALVTLFAGISSIAVAAGLGFHFGLGGVAAGALIARTLLLVASPWLYARSASTDILSASAPLLRPLAASVALIAVVSLVIQEQFLGDELVSAVAPGIGITAAGTLLWAAIGPTSAQRRGMAGRIRTGLTALGAKVDPEGPAL